jgi:hypothetical protein
LPLTREIVITHSLAELDRKLAAESGLGENATGGQRQAYFRVILRPVG